MRGAGCRLLLLSLRVGTGYQVGVQDQAPGDKTCIDVKIIFTFPRIAGFRSLISPSEIYFRSYEKQMRESVPCNREWEHLNSSFVFYRSEIERDFVQGTSNLDFFHTQILKNGYELFWIQIQLFQQ